MIPDFPSAPQPDLAALHAPYAPLLRAALALCGPAQPQSALDIGCGPGLKAEWLAERMPQGSRPLGIDIAPQALAAAKSQPLHPILADAHNLPVHSAAIDLVWMLFTLGLLEQPDHALAEARRVLRPPGSLVLAIAAQRWVRLRNWPPKISAAWGDRPAPPPADDLGADLIGELRNAGFRSVRLRAYLLDPPDRTPVAAALPLADWQTIHTYLGEQLDPALQTTCASIESATEADPMPILFIAEGQP